MTIRLFWFWNAKSYLVIYYNLIFSSFSICEQYKNLHQDFKYHWSAFTEQVPFIYLWSTLLINLRQLKGWSLSQWYPGYKSVFGSKTQVIVFGCRVVSQMIHNMIINKFLGYHIKYTYKVLGAQKLIRFLKELNSLVHWWTVSYCKDVNSFHCSFGAMTSNSIEFHLNLQLKPSYC